MQSLVANFNADYNALCARHGMELQARPAVAFSVISHYPSGDQGATGVVAASEDVDKPQV